MLPRRCETLVEKVAEGVVKFLRPAVGTDVFLYLFLFTHGEAVEKIIA